MGATEKWRFILPGGAWFYIYYSDWVKKDSYPAQA